jgi:hypothetical protein
MFIANLIILTSQPLLILSILPVNICMTSSNLYVPVFAADPANCTAQNRQSLELDRIVLQQIRENTRKRVVEIDVSQKVIGCYGASRFPESYMY